MNSNKVIRQATLAMATLAASAAWAHPGHAGAGATTTLLHLLTEPDHLVALLAAIGIGAWVVARAVIARGAGRKHRED